MKNHARGNKGRSGPGYRTPSTFRATLRYRQPVRTWRSSEVEPPSFRQPNVSEKSPPPSLASRPEADGPTDDDQA